MWESAEMTTHGMLLNEHKNLVLRNVEVEPSVHGQLKLNGFCNIARISKRQTIDEAADEERDPFTMRDLVDKLTE